MPDSSEGAFETGEQSTAYRMGYRDGSGGGDPDDWDVPDRADSVRSFAVEQFAHYTESARFMNAVGPTLRQLAGHSDPTGAGTYTGPADSRDVNYGMLFDTYRRGWLDGALEDTPAVPLDDGQGGLA